MRAIDSDRARIAALFALLAIAAVAGLVWLGGELAGGLGAAGSVLLILLLVALFGRWLWWRFTRKLDAAEKIAQECPYIASIRVYEIRSS